MNVAMLSLSTSVLILSAGVYVLGRGLRELRAELRQVRQIRSACSCYGCAQNDLRIGRIASALISVKRQVEVLNENLPLTPTASKSTGDASSSGWGR